MENMAEIAEPAVPKLPIPIFRVSSGLERYMLYDVNIVIWLRRTHNILGVLVGTLPQAPQQNVFLGLPLQLMPEEARFLVEMRIAHIVYDNEWHTETLSTLTEQQRDGYKFEITKMGIEAAKSADREKAERTARAMQRLKLKNTPKRSSVDKSADDQVANETIEAGDDLFGHDPSKTAHQSKSKSSTTTSELWGITPTTAFSSIDEPPGHVDRPLPKVEPSRYALFRHLHAHGYFMTPGLRFGCQFTVYPGDPLRFHSHFLAVAADWDEEIDLLDIVGGGRLGTAVKKGFMIGGLEPAIPSKGQTSHQGQVRTFCIEWGGM